MLKTVAGLLNEAASVLVHVPSIDHLGGGTPLLPPPPPSGCSQPWIFFSQVTCCMRLQAIACLGALG